MKTKKKHECAICDYFLNACKIILLMILQFQITRGAKIRSPTSEKCWNSRDIIHLGWTFRHENMNTNCMWNIFANLFCGRIACHPEATMKSELWLKWRRIIMSIKVTSFFHYSDLMNTKILKIMRFFLWLESGQSVQISREASL